jgi:hypothetical protein
MTSHMEDAVAEIPKEEAFDLHLKSGGRSAGWGAATASPELRCGSASNASLRVSLGLVSGS